VGKICVHLADVIGIGSNGSLKPGDAGRSEARLTLTVYHTDLPGKLSGEMIGQLSRAIRQIVVNHQ
jgi:hypothetical protein